MPLIIITSPESKTGQTSLVINLGFGLLREGRPVQLYDLGSPPGDLLKWASMAAGGAGRVPVWGGPDELSDDLACSKADLGKFVLVDLDWRNREAAEEFISGSGCLLATTPLKGLKVEKMLALEAEVKNLRGGRGIDLVVPSMVNSHSWGENEPGLLSLFEHFGEERIADPLPL
jgi:hypothetical protein